MKKNICAIHGEMNLENAYACKNPNGTIRLRCKECCQIRRVAYYNDNRTEATRKSSEWKRANRERVNAQVREDRKNNPEKYKNWQLGRHSRDPNLKAKLITYNIVHRASISREDYYEMFAKQNNLCAICNQPETRVFKGKLMRLCLDHNHDTGAVRQLLCHACNTGLGKFKESIDILQSAIDYLNKHNL